MPRMILGPLPFRAYGSTLLSMPDAVPALHPLEESAGLLHCKPRWLGKQLAAQRFSATKIGGHWYMTDDDIKAAIEACRPGPKPEPEDPVVAGLTPIARRRRERNLGAS